MNTRALVGMVALALTLIAEPPAHAVWTATGHSTQMIEQTSTGNGSNSYASGTGWDSTNKIGSVETHGEASGTQTQYYSWKFKHYRDYQWTGGGTPTAKSLDVRGTGDVSASVTDTYPGHSPTGYAYAEDECYGPALNYVRSTSASANSSTTSATGSFSQPYSTDLALDTSVQRVSHTLWCKSDCKPNGALKSTGIARATGKLPDP